MVQDLKESAQDSLKVGKAMSRPINTPMVLFSALPSPGFEESYTVKLYIQQKRLRRVICDEIFELMIINRHIQYDEGILPEDHEFWKLTDTTVWSSDLYTLLMRYGVKFTSYRIKSVYKSLDQTVLSKLSITCDFC